MRVFFLEGSNFEDRFDLLWRTNNSSSNQEILELAAYLNTYSQAIMGRMYRYGRGVEKDLRKSADLLRKASESRLPKWAKWDYCDVLWEIGTPNADAEMFEFAKTESDKGNPSVVAHIKEKTDASKKYSSIYHAGHYCFIWKFVVHKMLTDNNSKSLLLFDCSYCSIAAIHQIESNSILSKYFDIVCYRDTKLFLHSESIDCLKKNITDYFSDLLREKGVRLIDIPVVHSGIDDRAAFNVYLRLNNKSYNLWDTGSGIILIKDRHIEIQDEPSRKFYVDLIEEYQALTINDNVLSTIWPNNKYLVPEGIIIDSFEEYNLLDDCFKKDLLDIFGLSSVISQQKPVSIVALSSGWGLGEYNKMTKFEFYQLYRILIDYYLSGDTIIIKPHPNYDNIEDISREFAGCLYVPGYIPFELLCLCYGKSIKTIVSTSTYCVNGLGEYSVINLTQDAIWCHKSIYRAIVIHKIVSFFDMPVCFDLESKQSNFYSEFLKNLGIKIINTKGSILIRGGGCKNKCNSMSIIDSPSVEDLRHTNGMVLGVEVVINTQIIQRFDMILQHYSNELFNKIDSGSFNVHLKYSDTDIKIFVKNWPLA